jgi:hypothetical protein
MSDMRKESRQEADWNALTGRWLEVMSLDAEAQVFSPLEVLHRAGKIRCIAVASPLDLFAAHRFLLALLYWKADAAGGVQQVRESLLRGEVPRGVLDAVEAQANCFRLFDDRAPFLQDPCAHDDKTKSAGSLFAEFASGTNIAHFHHGDDRSMRLCVRCATIGMLRLVPWTPSGGQGLTPSVHNAPPIMAIASGTNLATSLGLNLVSLSGKPGRAKWSGHFVPTDKKAGIPYLEAFTWNPRRVHLRSPESANTCWRCGQTGVGVVGPIVYLKNEETQKRSDKQPFEWQDPAAFYAADKPYTTMKSYNEATAADGRDVTWLLDEEDAPTSAVIAANPDHQGWHLIVPCTNPANNKTFDHRQVALTGISPDAIRTKLPDKAPDRGPTGLDGWVAPDGAAFVGGAARFVRAAVRVLTYADWVTLSAAAYRDMHESPAAFDVLSGLLWSLRPKVKGLPSRNVAWLVLKLMAAVPPAARIPHRNATLCPLRFLPKRQMDERRQDRSAQSPYPVSFPRGRRLEAELRRQLDGNVRKRVPEGIDWAGLCHGLDQLLD